jgi:hypothetical protein
MIRSKSLFAFGPVEHRARHLRSRGKRTLVDFQALAYRGEIHVETGARRERHAQFSERRTRRHSVAEYLDWQEEHEFAEETMATGASVLRRVLKIAGPDDVDFGIRRIATLLRSDAETVLWELRFPDRMGEKVSSSTLAQNTKILHAWTAWEVE